MNLETIIKEQMGIEYPNMTNPYAKFKIQEREFNDINELASYVASEMWNTFDSTLFQVKVGTVVYE